METLLKNSESKLFNIYTLPVDLKKLYLTAGGNSINNLTFSPDGTYALVCGSNVIYKICFESQTIKSFQKGIGGTRSLTFLPNSNSIFICNSAGHYISKKNLLVDETEIPIFVGKPSIFGDFKNGPKNQAGFGSLSCIEFSRDGTFALICDSTNHCIRKLCLKSGLVSSFAGLQDTNIDFKIRRHRDGPKDQALFKWPLDLKFSPDGKFVLICDHYNHCIRKICLVSEQVSTLAGVPVDSALSLNAKSTIHEPRSIAISPDSKYVLVVSEHKILKICLESSKMTILVGTLPFQYKGRNGPKEQALLHYPVDIKISPDGKFIIICETRGIKYMRIKI
jgi:WD40 repeat protein